MRALIVSIVLTLGLCGSVLADPVLRQTSTVKDSLDFPIATAVSPDGNHVYTVTTTGLVLFSRNGTTGALEAVEKYEAENPIVIKSMNAGMPSAEKGEVAPTPSLSAVIGLTLLWGGIDVAVSPDGKHVYVANFVQSSVEVFQRNTQNGTLTRVETLSAEEREIIELVLPLDIEISSNGSHVYVIGFSGVGVFNRNSTTGQLTLTQSSNASVINGFADALIADAGLEPLDEPLPAVPGIYTYARGALAQDEHLYIVMPYALLTLSLDASTGHVTFQDYLIADTFLDCDFIDCNQLNPGLISSAPGILLGTDVVAAPDGSSVHVASLGLGAVTSFKRTSGTGALSYVETVADVPLSTSKDVEGLGGAYSLAMSGDGANIFVTGLIDSTLSVFNRNPATATLTHAGTVDDNNAELVDSVVNFFVDLIEQQLSPEPAELKSELILPREAPGFLYILSEGVAQLPSGRPTIGERIGLFGSNLKLNRSISAPQTKQINPTIGDGLFVPLDVAIDPGGDFAYTTGTVDGRMGVFSIADTGVPAYKSAHDASVSDVDGLVGVTSMIVSSDGANVYSTSFIDGAVAIFTRDESDGSLIFEDAIFDSFRRIEFDDVEGLIGGLRLAMSIDDTSLYVVNPFGMVAAFQRNRLTGALTYAGAIKNDGENITGLLGLTDLAVSPDGKHAYGVSAIDSAIVTFERDPETSSLTFNSAIFDVGINNESGLDPLLLSATIAISTDGAFVYVGSITGITIFSRDSNTGALTFVSHYEDRVIEQLANTAKQIASGRTKQETLQDTIDGFVAPLDMALAPEGDRLYVASVLGVSTLARDEATGELTFLTTQFDALVDPENGANGVLAGVSISVSFDGRFAYVASLLDQAVTVLARDPESDTLSFVESRYQAEIDIVDMFTPASTSLSPDGATLYVASPLNSALSVFEVGVFANMSGFLVNAEDQSPLVCATVILKNVETDEFRTAVADLNGFYFLRALDPGMYTGRLVATGFEDVDLGTFTFTENERRVQNFRSGLTRPMVGISGIVTDVDSNEPLVAARVEALIANNAVADTYTCASGAFELVDLPLAKGTQVTLRYSLVNYETVEQQVEIAPGETVVANQALEKSIDFVQTVSGIVYREEESGERIPVEGARVTIRGAANSSVFTDGEGIYSFNVPPGDYTIRASANGFTGRTLARSVPANRPSFASFNLSRASELRSDLNGDGRVAADDIQLVINFVLRIARSLENADVDRDGQVAAPDVQLVINAALGINPVKDSHWYAEYMQMHAGI